ncbi:MerR family transcriptional regulator [Psychromonas hadalis]|uniref:MerR family transcriptional regulator n=1 Tax=Psychromonas hadalis TaxID=211669 RepID=UPI0003B3CFF0|nr:MerR family transcriptional regulator [Psychromonas hadalis]
MTFTIGSLAQKALVNVETIRFYQRKGLLKKPIKPLHGYRQYDNQTLQRILFIKRAKKLGFTLKEIQDLLCIEKNRCHEIQHLAIEKRLVIQKKITDLAKLEETLTLLIEQCEITKETNHCAIVDAFK